MSVGERIGSRTGAALRAAVAAYVTRGLSLLLGLVVTPVVLASIGRETYGYWVIVGSVIGYVGMVDFGITGSVATLIAREQRDPASVSRIVTNALLALSGAGLLAVVLAFCAALLAPAVLRLEPDSIGLVRALIVLAGLGLGLSFPVRALKAAFRGTQRIALLRIVEFILSLFRIGLLLLLLHVGAGVFALPWSTVAASVLSTVVFLWLAKGQIRGLRLARDLLASGEVRRILGVSAWWFLGSLGALFIYQTDNIVVGRYLGPVAVTAYALTHRLPELVRGQLYQLNLAISPGIGDLVGRGEVEKLREIFPAALRIILFLGISAAALIIVLNRPFVTLWVGKENYAGDRLTLIFSLTLVYLLVFHTSSIILTNHLDLKVLATTRFVEGVLNLGLSLLLVGTFGTVGVAAATLIAGLATSGWFLLARAFRVMGVSPAAALGRIGVPTAIFCLVAVVTVTLAPELSDASWPRVLTVGGILGLWLAAMGWIVLLPRQFILQRVRRTAGMPT